MAVNYNDERFKEVEVNKKQALSEVERTYGGMIDESQQYYNAQIDASKQWADKQTQLQQEQTDFAIEKIEQEKDKAEKDYTREQSGAYVDWQKESNRYGTNAEQMAAQGLTNTGYGESSQVRMYNAYQSRVTAARESYNQAVLNYNNAIKDAQLQNNSILAEIAYEALQQQLELSLQGFQYQNQLVLEKANKKTELEQIYHSRYQDVLAQINTENAFAEQQRQFNEQLAEQQRQYNEERARSMVDSMREYELEVEKLEEQKRQFDSEQALELQRLAASMAANKNSGSSGSSKITNSSSGSSKSTKGGSGGSFDRGASVSANSTKATMNSILALGYGPLSAEGLAKLVQQGKVVEYKDNGVTKFKNASGVTPNSKNNRTANVLNSLFK